MQTRHNGPAAQPRVQIDPTPGQSPAWFWLRWRSADWHGPCLAGAHWPQLMSIEPTTPRHDHTPTNGCRVLVVDDDADNVELLLELLRAEGYMAASAENGAVALSLLSEGLDPDVILTDLMMPVMSGWALYESLKKDPSYCAIPLVVTCGMPAELRGQLQVDAAFDKPFDTDALLGKIAELCGR